MIKVALIGLDTSHTMQYAKRIQDPDCPRDQRVPGLRVTGCLRFQTPFQDKQGLDKRQAQLEAWGVPVTTRFDEAVSDCDALMLLINDGSYHLEYVRRVAALGKPVFLDKPMATTVADGRAIVRLAHRHRLRIWSSSSVPFCPDVAAARKQAPVITRVQAYGALGRAPAGDSLMWYGVHTVETMSRLMGPGARSVRAVETDHSILAVVDYGAGREGVVDVHTGHTQYGGRVFGRNGAARVSVPYVCDNTYAYRDMLRRNKAFFSGGPAPLGIEAAFEGLAIMAAMRASIRTGKPARVARLAGAGS